MPVHYGSGSSIPLSVSVSNIGASPGQIEWYRKKASDSTWTEIESDSIQADWGHGQQTSDSDFPASRQFLNDAGEVAFLNQGDNKTVTIDGTEFTIEATSLCPDSCSPSTAAITINGNLLSVNEGGYLKVNGELFRANNIESDDVGNEYISIHNYGKYDTPNDGRYEYKVKVETDSNEFYHSQPIYLDVSSLNNNNLPYIDDVKMDGQNIFPFQQLSGISPGATIYVDVIEREGDSYNVKLEERGSSAQYTYIQKQTVASDGTIENAYSKVLDFFFDPFFDTAGLKGDNSKRLAFKILPEERQAGADLFGSSKSYNFGFEIQDANEATLRRTTDYTLTTNGTAYQPNITKVEGSKDCSTYSSLSNFDSKRPIQCIRVTAHDQDTEQLYIGMNLTEQYDGIKRNSYSVLDANYHQRNGDKYIWNLSRIDVPTSSINASGTWKAEFKASDSISTDTQTVSWSVPWGSLSVDIQPASSFSLLSNETFNMQLDLSCSGGPECVNQNESVELYWDPKSSSNLLGGLT